MRYAPTVATTGITCCMAKTWVVFVGSSVSTTRRPSVRPQLEEGGHQQASDGLRDG
ncbi:hypothetical protein [Halalkalicoccus jeotgali]|uniref:hypothetical protein n=1 Tax=Halalkalicoccus jeotgali TaxID=413810 RepID=UPI000A7C575F|nr:hypothetical protein [Halalkalicoccus jeotgali]